MIYEKVDPSAPIRQGDTFHPLPYCVVSLDELHVASSDGTKKCEWDDISREPTSALFHVVPTWAIVASQDCDASNRPEVTCFRIDGFREVTGLTPPGSAAPEAKKLKWWTETLAKKSRLFARWFYLPLDSSFGFDNRMAVDFCKVMHLGREELETRRAGLRQGRLCDVAYEHFRESIAHFYLRHPYDEWYSFTREEYRFYSEDRPAVEPYDWQK